jgi:outer membrane receptor protein involved in Fe transport
MKKLWVSLLLGVLFAGPAEAQLRLAEIAGTVTDETGAVLPGATVTAIHVATAQSRSTTTGARGTYLLNNLPVGTYLIKAELAGFNTIALENYTLGIGDSTVLNLQMKVATVEESVTVVAESPLIDTTKSDLAGRINQIQIEDLPLNGRNWLNLATLAPGVKSVGRGGQPESGVGDSRMSKVILDGGNIQNLSTQAIDLEISQEIVGEFEVLTNRFDAVMGRAGTTVVNAVTKGGTDAFHGSGFFFFRDDSLNAEDFFTGRVEPYQNRQLGGTFGGPLVRGKTHFFGSFERQVEPKTLSANTGFAIFDQPVDSTDERNLYFVRVDHSLTGSHRLSGRYNRFHRVQPFNDVGGTRSVSNSHTNDFKTDRVNFGLNSVFGNNLSNQLHITYLNSVRLFNRFYGPPPRLNPGLAPYEEHQHVFPAVTIGQVTNVGNERPHFWVFRDDASYYLEKWGRHSIKFGGDFTRQYIHGVFASNANGTFFYDSNPANLASCCPGGDQTKWDTSQFAVPIRYTQQLGDAFYDAPNDIYGFYLQDDWTVADRLTLNLGLRYDLEIGSLAHDNTGLVAQPHPNDKDNFQPRLGFAWDVLGSGKTILRGGGGLYVDQVFLNVTFNQRRTNSGALVSVTTFNPNRDPAFVQNPLGGRTFDDFIRTAGATNVTIISPDAEQPQVWAVSLGLAQQLTPELAVSADYVHQRSNNMLRAIDSNLFCCLPDGNALPVVSGNFAELGGQVTGVGRPNRNFNTINTHITGGKSRYHGLQVAVNKRWSRKFQFTVSYLLSKNEDDHNGAFSSPTNMFRLQDEYSRSLLDQRHRFVTNWVATLPYDFSLGAVLFAASGQTRAVNSGGIDVNGDGSTGGDRPLCGIDPRFNPGCSFLGIPNGQRVPRNALVTDPVVRLDLRLSRTFALERFRLEPIFEVFNLLNRRNYDPNVYNGTLSNARFGQPGRSDALPYLPRQMQLAVRMTF